MAKQISDVPADYEDWLERLRATYDSVAFCCRYQLGDPRHAETIGVRVIAALVDRPGIFKYSGLPFSGRLARHTERGIEQARNGELQVHHRWIELVEPLREIDLEHQEIMVLGFIDHRDDDELAEFLRCSVANATRRRQRSLAAYQRIAAAALGPTTPPINIRTDVTTQQLETDTT